MDLAATSGASASSALLEGWSARQRADIARQTVPVTDLPQPTATPSPAQRVDGLVRTAASAVDVAKNASTIFQTIKADHYMIDLYA